MASHIPRFAEVATPLRHTITLARKLDEQHVKGGRRPSAVLFPLASAASRAFAVVKELVANAEDIVPFNERACDTVLVSDASANAIAGYLIQDGR